MEASLTDFPIPDIGRRMGRPPLKKDVRTIQTMVRMPLETQLRIKALVGDNRMATFIREAIEIELERREREAAKSPKPE